MGPRRYELKLQVPALIARSVGPRHPSAIARLKHRSPLTRIDCRSAQAWVPAMEEDQSEDGEDGHAHLQPGAHLRLLDIQGLLWSLIKLLLLLLKLAFLIT